MVIKTEDNRYGLHTTGSVVRDSGEEGMERLWCGGGGGGVVSRDDGSVEI